MTNEELKTALVSGCPVESGGIVYKCVSAIIYRYRNGKLDISAEVAEVTDYCGHSISIISPERAKIVESEVKQ